MAGFSLFHYDKEGPGVAKNGPKKRPFVVFLEIYWRKFWKLFQAGLLFLLTGLPLVTRGLADAGLCFITRNFAREKHAFVAGDFFATIRKNHKQAFVCGLINQLVSGILIFNLMFYAFRIFPGLYTLLGMNITSDQVPELNFIDLVIVAVSLFGYVIFTMMKYYIPIQVVTFKLTTKQIYQNALALTFGGMKRNLLISLILFLWQAVAVLIVLLNPVFSTLLLVCLIGVLFYPSFRSLVIQFGIFPLIQKTIIDPYYQEHPDADRQLRMDLNLDVPEDPAEEVLFEDRPEPAMKKEENTIPRQYEKPAGRLRSTASDEDDDTI